MAGISLHITDFVHVSIYCGKLFLQRVMSDTMVRYYCKFTEGHVFYVFESKQNNIMVRQIIIGVTQNTERNVNAT